jgi:hypothetical protein
MLQHMVAKHAAKVIDHITVSISAPTEKPAESLLLAKSHDLGVALHMDDEHFLLIEMDTEIVLKIKKPKFVTMLALSYKEAFKKSTLHDFEMALPPNSVHVMPSDDMCSSLLSDGTCEAVGKQCIKLQFLDDNTAVPTISLPKGELCEDAKFVLGG